MSFMDKRICIFSQRNLGKLVSRCGVYEYEDVICSTDDVDIKAPDLIFSSKDLDCYRYGTKISNWLARNVNIININPNVRKITVKKDYDLFIAFFQFPADISSINAIIDWRKRCRIAICWVEGTWINQLAKYKNTFKLLSEFDFIIINFLNSIESIKTMIDIPCVYMPLGIDMIRFCPYPNPPIRSIDVYSRGRRLPSMHQNYLNYHIMAIFSMYMTHLLNWIQIHLLNIGILLRIYQ